MDCGTVAPYGDYPISMKKNADARIPTFISHESEQVKGSHDFISAIHYMNINVTNNLGALNIQLRDYNAKMAANLICKYSIKFMFEQHTERKKKKEKKHNHRRWNHIHA